MISSPTVPWVAVENTEGFERAVEWIDSPKEHLALAGWATLGAWVAVHPDAESEIMKIRRRATIAPKRQTVRC